MTRIFAFPLLAALAALGVGCVPLDNPAGKEHSKPPATAPASGSGPARDLAGGPPAEPPLPLPGDDPRHVALRSYRSAVGGREEEIAAALLRIDAAAGKVATAPADQQTAVDEFRKLVPLLRDASRALLSDHRAVLEATESLLKDLRHGPTAFRQAARAWRERAEDYSVEAFRQNALGYAEAFDRYADKLPDRRKEIQGFAEELREQVPFLRELGSSVEDLSRFLEQHPGQGLPDPRPQYVAQLRAFATPLTVFQGQIGKYLNALRGRSDPAVTPAAAPAATPAAPETPRPASPPRAEPIPAERQPLEAAVPASEHRFASNAGPVFAPAPVQPVPCSWPQPVQGTPCRVVYVVRSR